MSKDSSAGDIFSGAIYSNTDSITTFNLSCLHRSFASTIPCSKVTQFPYAGNTLVDS